MKKFWLFSVMMSLLFAAPQAFAKDKDKSKSSDKSTESAAPSSSSTSSSSSVEFVSTDEARKQGTLHSDSPSVDDPYMNRKPSQRDLDGAPLTQGSYQEGCTADHCKRAEQRQTDETTDWREDVKKGRKVGGY